MSYSDKEKSKEEELDEFWNISSLIDLKKEIRNSVRDALSTEAVEISFDMATGNSGIRSSKLSSDINHIYNKNEPAKPDYEYSPSHPLLKNVSVYSRNIGYRYYEQFLDHAKRSVKLDGQKCEKVTFFSYIPQFSQLSKPQLDWYLWWRKCVHNNEFPDTDYSYILLYIYEIINTNGHSDFEWGLDQLCSILLAYRNIYPRLDRQLSEWICDYCLLLKLDAPVQKLSGIIDEMLPSCTFKEFYMSNTDIFDGRKISTDAIITYCSNYNYKNSKFYSKYKDLFDKYIPLAVESVFNDQNSCDSMISDIPLNEKAHISREAYVGALCSYEIKKHIEIDYISPSRSYELRYIISDMIKHTENLIRAYVGIKSRLTTPSLSDKIKKIIDTDIGSILITKKRTTTDTADYEKLYDVPKTPVSFENAKHIEEDSWQTTDQLLDSFNEDTTINIDVTENKNDITFADFDLITEATTLNDAPNDTVTSSPLTEYMDFLHSADIKDFNAEKKFAQQKGMMLDVLAEKINEVAIEYIGDIILEATDSGYTIIDDYRKEIFDD